jgi:large subunit ribosomal protein L15
MLTLTIKKPDSHKRRKRVGRGPSSGMGKTSTRGMNGQMCRSGATRRAWFEGGQMPLLRRVPKRGFNNIFKKDYQLISVEQLNKLSETEVTPEVLKKAGLVKKADKMVKLLGDGEIKKAVNLYIDAYTTSAKEKIEKAGGKINNRVEKSK